MAIDVYRVFLARDGDLVAEGSWPRRCQFKVGDVAAVLTNARPSPDGGGPKWAIPIQIGKGASLREVVVPIQAFLSAAEYRQSAQEPFSFARIKARGGFTGPDEGVAETRAEADRNWSWFFRDALYLTERVPAPSEIDEVVLRIKAIHFQHDDEIRRLREKVANFEAIDSRADNHTGRKPISDDVKLLVWSRDGGACVKCGSRSDLHFDHIIPLAKGGGDHAENIQLLCRSCNLSKKDRLV